MTASELLADLRSRGVKLWIDGSNLRFNAPKGAIDPAAASLLSRHKPQLIRLVEGHEAPDGPSETKARHPNGFSLDGDVLSLSSIDGWSLDDQPAYVRHVSPYKGFLYARMGLDKTFVRGEGCHLIDEAGTRYADFIAQFGAVPFGHDPEPIWEAIAALRRDRAPNLVATSISRAAGALAERLLGLAPAGLAHVVFTNSGTEAVEAAIKLARCFTGRHGILSARGSFHGLTLGALSATGRDFFQRGFGAPASGFNYVPFGDLAALESTLAARPGYFAAFIVEPIQGESGIVPAPAGYLKAAHAICRRYGTLLIVDEVQTGLGRTGDLFACDAEGVSPDILTLAKALGGGLVPVGACLYARSVYTEHFDLRHGSTFGGNALACRAAMASLDELTRDDRRLVRHVDTIGRALRADLDALRAEYPGIVADVRGKGLMLGIELDLEQVAEEAGGVISALQQQGLLLYLIVSYLLNVAHVRVAPSFTQGSVLRIEPPLIADEALCGQLVSGLRRLLAILAGRDAGALLEHLVAEPGRTPALAAAVARPPRRAPAPGIARFAFVVHLLSTGDLRRFDPTFARFSDDQLGAFRARIHDFVSPFAAGRLHLRAPDGREAAGELIVLPYAPDELLKLSGGEARDLVQHAVDIGAERGAEVIGLGGFSSIICDGGLALRSPANLRITSGNSLTTWAAFRAVEEACETRGIALADCTVAVVGAAGAIGQALSRLCAERAGRLILIGNPTGSGGSLQRLERLANECGLTANGQPQAACAIGATLDVGRLREADIVITATSAVAPFIVPEHLRRGALICDVSRPPNAMPHLFAQRPDLTAVAGALLRAPEGAELDYLAEPGRPNVLVACAAETVVLALSGYRGDHLCGQLDLGTIAAVGRLAREAGFAVAEGAGG